MPDSEFGWRNLRCDCDRMRCNALHMEPSKRKCASAPRYLPFKPLPLAVQFSASHMTMHMQMQQARRLSGSGLAIAAPRQAHGEHRALAVLAGDSHIAAHHARELAREGKAEPRSTVAARNERIGLGELLE